MENCDDLRNMVGKLKQTFVLGNKEENEGAKARTVKPRGGNWVTLGKVAKQKKLVNKRGNCRQRKKAEIAHREGKG